MQVEVANQNVIKVLIVMFCDILRDKKLESCLVF